MNFRYDAEFRKELGRILGQNRRARGLELPQAAHRLNVDPFWLRRVEEGNEEVSQDIVETIAFNYGINFVRLQIAFERKFLSKFTFSPSGRSNHLRHQGETTNGHSNEEKGPSPQG